MDGLDKASKTTPLPPIERDLILGTLKLSEAKATDTDKAAKKRSAFFIAIWFGNFYSQKLDAKVRIQRQTESFLPSKVLNKFSIPPVYMEISKRLYTFNITCFATPSTPALQSSSFPLQTDVRSSCRCLLI